MQRENHEILSNENWAQGKQIDDLKERVAVLEQEEVKQPFEQTNEFFFLGKRIPEDDLPLPLEEKIPDVSSSQDLGQRLDRMLKNFNTSHSGIDLKRKSKK